MQIKVTYQKLKTNSPLDIIDSIWLIQTNNSSINHKLLPNNYSDLIINIGSPVTYNNTCFHGIHFNGIQNNYSSIIHNGTIFVIGVTIKPFGACALTNGLSLELCNTRVNVLDLNKALFSDLIAIQYNDLNSSIIFNKIQQIIYRSINLKHLPDEKTIKMFDYFNNTLVDNIDINCNCLGISKRQLERVFNNYIGISPKLFTQKVRFKNTLNLLKKMHNNLTRISQDSGYYDQNHMIKEFKRFSGEIPSTYLKTNKFIKQICI